MWGIDGRFRLCGQMDSKVSLSIGDGSPVFPDSSSPIKAIRIDPEEGKDEASLATIPDLAWPSSWHEEVRPVSSAIRMFVTWSVGSDDEKWERKLCYMNCRLECIFGQYVFSVVGVKIWRVMGEWTDWSLLGLILSVVVVNAE